MAKNKPINTIEDLYKYLRNREHENNKRILPGSPDIKVFTGKAEAYRNASEKTLELLQKLQVKS
jgi:hypothetical protein